MRMPFLSPGYRTLFQKLCQQYELVYFGTVNQHTDEHELVRGVTLSPKHLDEHFCVGSIEGRDVIFLQRTDTIAYPGKKPVDYSWLMLQVDLSADGLPHTFLDGHHHEEVFYDNLLTKYSRFSKLDISMLVGVDPLFEEAFGVYTLPDLAVDAARVLGPDTTSVLGNHFTQFDFEWFGDRLIVYANIKLADQQLCDEMVRAGVWLAGQLEYSGA